jgi:hypothetical protein
MMAQKLLNVILLHALMTFVCANDVNTSLSAVRTVEITNKWLQADCMVELCPLGKTYQKQLVPNEEKEIHVGLLLPSKQQTDQINSQTLSTIMPVIDLAIENVKKQSLLNGYKLVVHPRDTQCSSTIGPLAAFELHNRKEADIFLGPICDYVLAPVARYASVWQKSVISTGGLAAAFNYKVSQLSKIFLDLQKIGRKGG